MLHSEIWQLTFQVVIALCGVIGNILVIIVITGLGKKKKPADFYVQNLAIADLGTLLLTFPLAAIKEKAPYNWPFGEFICLYLYPVPEIFYGASVWFIAVIAIERYRIIASADLTCQYRNIFLKKAKIVAACVWGTSFLIFCLPLYFVVEYFEFPNGACGPVWHPWVLARVYIVSLTLFSYVLPIASISFTYLAISRAIDQNSVFIKAVQKQIHDVVARNRLCSSLTNIKSLRLKQNRRAKKILTPLVLVFALTMLPINIFRLIMVFWPTIAAREYYQNMLYVITVFVILNSTANPVIYYKVSENFRKGIKKILRLGFGCGFV